MNGIDTHTQEKIWNSLTPIVKEKTLIWIAHEFNEFQRFDRLLRIHGGRLEEK
jgi:ABC-type transport system involved in cytochrome bd biosynthesis fused ATPase/permease subunit